MSKYIKLFETKQDAIDDQNLVSPIASYCRENNQTIFFGQGETDTPIEIIEKEDGYLMARFKKEKVDCVLISCIGEEQDMGEDPDGYYQFNGEWEYEGETYYQWIKISSNGWPACAGRIGLTTERTFEDASIDNPSYFAGWLMADSIEPEYCSDDIIGFEKKEKVSIETPEHHDTSEMDKNGYEYVDLGLPSGALWAKCNVGAESEEEYGRYFQWGDTIGYTGQDALDHSYWHTCPFNNGSEEYDDEYFLANKSQWLTEKDELKPEYDAAHVNMGGDWKLPRTEFIVELLRYTTSEYIEDYEGTGINGRLFRSLVNDNTLFIPFSGNVWDGSFYDVGSHCYLWSGRLDSSDPNYAYYLHCGSGGAELGSSNRYRGFALRGFIW